MPSDTPKYGGANVDLLKVAGRVEAVKPMLDQLKAEVKANEELEAAEQAAARAERDAAGVAKAGAVERRGAATAINDETKALEAEVNALRSEAAAVRESTVAWEANARARLAATRPLAGGTGGAGVTAAESEAAIAAQLSQAQSAIAKRLQVTAKQMQVLVSDAIGQGTFIPAPNQKGAVAGLEKKGLIGPLSGGTYGISEQGIAQVKKYEQAAQSAGTTQVAASQNATRALTEQAAAQERLNAAQAGGAIGQARPFADYRNVPLTVGGAAGGSADARFATGPAGEKYVVKTYGGDANRVSSEILANRVYQTLGIPAPAAGLGTVNGVPAVVSPFITGAPRKITQAYEGINQGLAADALLANRDVFGFEHNPAHENIIFDEKGVPHRIDQGGALKYRGEGGRKEFGAIPTELQSLPQYNPTKYAVSEAELRAQAGQVGSVITPAKLKELSAGLPFDPGQGEKLEERLGQRASFMRQYAAGQVAIDGTLIESAKSTSTAQIAASSAAADAEALNAAKIEATQKALLASYDLSFGERAALFAPGGANTGGPRSDRFYEKLFQRDLVSQPLGGGLTRTGQALRDAYEAHPTFGADAAQQQIDEALAHKHAPAFGLPKKYTRAQLEESLGLYAGADDTTILRGLRQQISGFGPDQLDQVFRAGPLPYPAQAAAIGPLREYIEQRSQAIAQIEGLVNEEGKITTFRSGPLRPGVSPSGLRPLPAFTEKYGHYPIELPLPLNAVRAYGAALLPPGFGFNYEEEVTVSSQKVRNAVTKKAAAEYDAAAAKAVVSKPQLLEGLGGGNVNDLILAKLYKDDHKISTASKAALAAQGLLGPSGNLTSAGHTTAAELIDNRILGYTPDAVKYKGATGTNFTDAYAGRTTPEQAKLVERLEKLQATASSVSTGPIPLAVSQAEAQAQALSIPEQALIAHYKLTKGAAEGLFPNVYGTGNVSAPQLETLKLNKLITGSVAGPVKGGYGYTDAGVALKGAIGKYEAIYGKGSYGLAIAHEFDQDIKAKAEAAGGAPPLPPVPPKTTFAEPPPEPERPVQKLLGSGAPPGYFYTKSGALLPIGNVPTIDLGTGTHPFVAGPIGHPFLPAGGAQGLTEEGVKAAEYGVAAEETGARLNRLGNVSERVNKVVRQSQAEYAAASSALSRHGALSTEFIGALARGEVTLREFGDATVATIGKFSGWAVAGGLVYGAYEALKRITEGAKATSVGVTQLERADIPNFSRGAAERQFLDISRRLNVPIGTKEGVAEAEFYVTRAGFRNQREIGKASETALEAQKLDQVPIQDATKALGSLRIAFGLNADQIHRVFEELDVGQLRFNARLNQTLPQLGRSAAAVANAGGNVHELAQQLITVVGATGGGGGTGGGNPATFFLREPGNVRRASAAQTLREVVPDIYERELKEPNITRFNKEIAERASKLSAQQQANVAYAIGGGTAIGGRYAITLVNSGPSGRLAAVEQQAGHPGSSVERDLSKRISQFDEQAKKIGLTFERLGAEIGKIGLTNIAEDVVRLFGFLGGALEVITSPLARFGDALSKIPGFVQQALIGLAALSVGQRVIRSNKALGLSVPAAEAIAAFPGGSGVAAFVNNPGRQLVRDTRRTTSELDRRYRSDIERLTQEGIALNPALQAAGVRRDAVTEEYNRRQAQYGPQLGFSEEEVPQREAFLASMRAAEAAFAAAAEAQARNTALLDEAQARLIENTRIAAIATEKGVPIPAIKQRLEREGVELAGGGPGSIYGAAGPTGSRQRALALAYEEHLAGNKPLPAGSQVEKDAKAAYEAQRGADAQSKAAEATARSAGAMAVNSELMATATEQRAREEEAAAVTLKATLSTLATSIKEGTAEIAASFATSALLPGASLVSREGPGGVGGGLGKIFGGLGALGGFLTKNLTKDNLFKAFNIGLIGSLGSELVGGVVGGKTGGAISNIGSKAALGAAIGTFLPGGPLTTIAGGVIGGGIGLAESLLSGGDDTGRKVKIREARIAQETAKLLKAPSSGAQLQEASDVFGSELETAFGEDQKAAEAAQKTIDKSIKVAAAALKLFKPGSTQGHNVLRQLEGETQATVEQLAAHPEKLEQTSELLEKQLDTALRPIEEEFQKAAAKAKTPVELGKAHDRREKQLYELYETLVKAPTQKYAEAIAEAQKRVDADEKQQRAGKAVGNGYTPREAEAQRAVNRLKAQERSIGQPKSIGEFEELKAVQEAIKVESGPLREREKRLEQQKNEHKDFGDKIQENSDKQAAARKKLAQVTREIAQESLRLAAAERGRRGEGGKVESNDEIRAQQDRLRSQKDKEHNLVEEQKDLRYEYNQLTKGGKFTPTQVSEAAKRAAKDKTNLAELKKQQEFFGEVAKTVNERINAAKGQEREFVELLEKLDAPQLELDLAKAGPSPAAKRGVKRAHRTKLLHEALLKGPLDPATRDKAASEVIEEHEAEAKEQVEAIDDREKRELSEAHPYETGRLANIKVARAKEKVSKLKALFHQAQPLATVKEIHDAENQLRELENQQAEQVAQEAQALISARGSLAQAQLAGNSIGQADAAIRTARELLGTAKKPSERIADEAQVVAAENQRQQAQEQRIAARGAYEESATQDPYKQARIKQRTAERRLGAAHGPDETLERKTEVNNARNAARQAYISKREEDVSFELEFKQISSQQAISVYEGLLKTKEIDVKSKRDLLSKIRQLREGGNNEPVFSIKPGDIKLPSIYDVRKKLEEAGREAIAQSAVPTVSGRRPQPITSGDLAAHRAAVAHISNTNHVTIIVRDNSDLREVGEQFEKITGANLRARRRLAGRR